VLIEARRPVVELERAAPATGASPVGPVGSLQLHPGSLGQHLQGLSKVDSLDLLDEREDVAALVTPVAVPHLLGLADDEARSLLRVQGAEPGVLPTGAVQGDVAADDLENVEPGLDLGDGVIRHGRMGRCELRA
jgi:hypothetical protein